MPEAVAHEVAEVARETMEKLAFVFALDEPAAASPPTDPEHRVQVAFRGPRRGMLEVALSAGALPELAANMLGVENPSELSADERTDALRELANVICGNLLPRLFGENAEFTLGTPVALREDAPEGAGGAAADCRLALENGACRVRLFLEGGGLPGGGGRAEEGAAS
ncbi:MAG: chemotaxis protein CheX [Desulfobacterales bacterium]